MKKNHSSLRIGSIVTAILFLIFSFVSFIFYWNEGWTTFLLVAAATVFGMTALALRLVYEMYNE